jgi:hypothetical protein
MTTNQPSMLIVSSEWNDKKTFRLIAITNNCPFNEVIYDPEIKTLAIISKEKKQSFQMLPKLDPNGDLTMIKRPTPSGRKLAEERKVVETYYEYYITNEEEIKAFVTMFAINADTHEWSSLL